MNVEVDLREYLEPKVREIIRSVTSEDEEVRLLLDLFEKTADKVVRPYNYNPFGIAINDTPHNPLKPDITYSCMDCRTHMEDERS